MALQLVLGNAGAGKSHYIFEKSYRNPWNIRQSNI